MLFTQHPWLLTAVFRFKHEGVLNRYLCEVFPYALPFVEN